MWLVLVEFREASSEGGRRKKNIGTRRIVVKPTSADDYVGRPNNNNHHRRHHEPWVRLNKRVKFHEKFQAVAEKNAKNQGAAFLPHPVCLSVHLWNS